MSVYFLGAVRTNVQREPLDTDPADSRLMSASPSIEFEQERIELGVLPEREIVSVIVRVTNTGQGTLEIERVQTACPLYPWNVREL